MWLSTSLLETSLAIVFEWHSRLKYWFVRDTETIYRLSKSLEQQIFGRKVPDPTSRGSSHQMPQLLYKCLEAGNQRHPESRGQWRGIRDLPPLFWCRDVVVHIDLSTRKLTKSLIILRLAEYWWKYHPKPFNWLSWGPENEEEGIIIPVVWVSSIHNLDYNGASKMGGNADVFSESDKRTRSW